MINLLCSSHSTCISLLSCLIVTGTILEILLLKFHTPIKPITFKTLVRKVTFPGPNLPYYIKV